MRAGRWLQAGRARVQSIGLRGPLILLSVGVVFLCCFALARVLQTHASARGESTSFPVEAFSAAPPLRMGSAPAIESALAPPVRPAPKPQARTQPRFAAPAPGGEISHSEEAQAPPATSAAPAAPVAERAPEPAPAPPARSSPPSGGSSHPSSGGGGGSFESSG